MHWSKTSCSPGAAAQNWYEALIALPPSASPARQIVAAAKVSPGGAANSQLATSVFAVRTGWSPRAARREPPDSPHVSRTKVKVPVFDPLHPSTGAAAPDGIRHE